MVQATKNQQTMVGEIILGVIIALLILWLAPYILGFIVFIIASIFRGNKD